MAYRALVLAEAKVDALVSCITLASTVSRDFRQNDLKPNTIALIPAGGYQRKEIQSIKALK